MSVKYSYIVGSHMNAYLSGVAKFNQVLARHLGIGYVGLADVAMIDAGPLLVSVKMAANDGGVETARKACASMRGRGIAYDLFLHSFQGLTVEYELIEGCTQVIAGNSEIAHALRDVDRPIRALWCPALVDESASVDSEGLTLFSFGMSHKIQLDYYELLKDVLERRGAEYTVLVSTAFHETASFGEIDVIERRFGEIFGPRAHLLGFLSDGAVNHFIERADLFAAFFRNGVRANNTSVYAAMGRGCALLTNLDEYSPEWMAHGVNVLDVQRLTMADLEAASLERLSERARSDASERASWGALVDALSE
jgi:hypothetical protein